MWTCSCPGLPQHFDCILLLPLNQTDIKIQQLIFYSSIQQKLKDLFYWHYLILLILYCYYIYLLIFSSAFHWLIQLQIKLCEQNMINSEQAGILDKTRFFDDIDKIEQSFGSIPANKLDGQKKYLQQQKYEEEAEDDIRIRFNQLHPAQQKIVKHGALQFDIKLGWVPKAQISGPIPIAFAHPDMDDLISQHIPLQSFVYFGYRPTNTFDVHRKFYKQGKSYPFNQFHLVKSQFLQRFFRKYYSQYDYDSPRKEGMVSDSPLIFDSFFEGGNLDAVYFEEGQYKLVIRTDTNTKGHCLYYYFRVKCETPGKYIFKIMNMSKPKSLYLRGMKPYIRTKQNPNWVQGCTNIKFGPSRLSEQYELKTKMNSLRFEYQFTGKQEQVQFCYGIPFLYSDLLNMMQQFRQYPNFHLNKLCYTLSGLQIPLVTITQKEKQEQQQKNKKHVIIISGRVHPGQTHGSHILNGLMKALLNKTSQASMLRKNIIFKIIPMINPDGVVIGNTRTSFSGKDLNRVYTSKIDFVFPQIIGITDFTKKLKQKYGQRLLFFIDVHGHSTRKNSFFFGPEYSVFQTQYTKCRMLAKIFSNLTQIFRYYSCKFRLSSFKQKTCRGYFNSNEIVRTYTFQTSMHGFFNFDTRKDISFTKENLQELGKDLMLAIHNYVKAVVKLDPIVIAQPVDKKKIYRSLALKQQQSDNSDDMPSQRADSQDSEDDMGFNQLQIFFNRINQNREYFFEELMSFNNIPFTKSEKKIKKKQIQTEKKLTQIQQKQVEIKKDVPVIQNIKKKQKIKNQWVPKYDFSLRKRQFQSYEKLANVVFGNTNMESFKNNVLYTSHQSQETLQKPKYTFINPIFKVSNYDIANEPKYQSTMNKYSDSRQQSKSRFFIQKDFPFLKTGVNNSPVKKQKSVSQVIDKKIVILKPKILHDHQSLQKLLLSPKNLAILEQIQSKKSLKEDSKINKQTFRSTSLKILPRKKSIKSFKSGDKISKKTVKNLNQKGLATRLPYIEKILSNF